MAIYPSNLLSPSRGQELLKLTGFREGKFLSMTYLGASLVLGRLLSRMEFLVEKNQDKVTGWKGKLLSQGSQLILLRHVPASMPLYMLSVIDVPKITIDQINVILENFIW